MQQRKWDDENDDGDFWFTVLDPEVFWPLVVAAIFSAWYWLFADDTYARNAHVTYEQAGLAVMTCSGAFSYLVVAGVCRLRSVRRTKRHGPR